MHHLDFLKSAATVLKQTLWHPKVRVILGLGSSLAIALLVVLDMEWGSLSHQFEDFPIGYALASLFIFSVATPPQGLPVAGAFPR